MLAILAADGYPRECACTVMPIDVSGVVLSMFHHAICRKVRLYLAMRTAARGRLPLSMKTSPSRQVRRDAAPGAKHMQVSEKESHVAMLFLLLGTSRFHPALKCQTLFHTLSEMSIVVAVFACPSLPPAWQFHGYCTIPASTAPRIRSRCRACRRSPAHPRRDGSARRATLGLRCGVCHSGSRWHVDW